MARKKIREYSGKRLLQRNIGRFSKLSFAAQVNPVLVTAETLSEWKKLKNTHPWLLEEKLVAKPDMLFGKRGKYGLVKVNANLKEVKQFINEKLSAPIKIGEVTGQLTHWLVEPFVPHKEEFYFSIESQREQTVVNFSTHGGIEVEENWDKIKTISIPVGGNIKNISAEEANKFYEGVPENLANATKAYVEAMFDLFEDLDFVSLETNPFTLVQAAESDIEHSVDGWQPVPLDLCAELDDTAFFKHTKQWDEISFPDVWGNVKTPEEKYIESLDAKTGASLKLTILKPAPEGRIWTLVAGGGASVIFADTIGDLQYSKYLGNYGEYSGGPNTEQMYEYSKTVLELATQNPDGQGRALLIGGGIANFTDVAKTFLGIRKALLEFKSKLIECKFQIYVRRAGPNFKRGLELMQTVGKQLGIPMFVYDHNYTMTAIIPMAVDYIKTTTTN